MVKTKAAFLFLLLSVVLCGCAAVPTDPDEAKLYYETNDPLEPMNRKIFAFNEFAENNVIRPVAKGYRYVTPELFRNSVSNFFDNLKQPVHFANALLQGEFKSAGCILGRFVLNTIWGVGGLFDVATEANIPNPANDFGQTLAKWGWSGDGGAYLVLPVLGPSSVRDGIGRGVDALAEPATWVVKPEVWYAGWALDNLNSYAENVDLLENLEKSSTDHYAMLRTMYRQNRAKKINSVLGDSAKTGENATPAYEADFSDIDWEDE